MIGEIPLSAEKGYIFTMLFFHVLLAMVLLGGGAASYGYWWGVLRVPQTLRMPHGLLLSLVGDGFLCILFFLLFFTGSQLVHSHHLSLSTPWIRSAYFLLASTFLMWLISVFIKIIYYRQINCSNDARHFFWNKVYHGCYFLMGISLVTIIHDAVAKDTVLPQILHTVYMWIVPWL